MNKNIGNCLYTGIMTDTGSFRFPSTTAKTHKIIAALIEAGAENLETEDNAFEITSTVESFGMVRDYLVQKYGDPLEAKVIWRPTTMASCDEDAAQSLLKLIDVLEDNDDVQNVYSNGEMSEDVLKKLSA